MLCGIRPGYLCEKRYALAPGGPMSLNVADIGGKQSVFR